MVSIFCSLYIPGLCRKQQKLLIKAINEAQDKGIDSNPTISVYKAPSTRIHIVFDTFTPSVYTTMMVNHIVLKTLSKVERFQNDTVTSTLSPHSWVAVTVFLVRDSKICETILPSRANKTAAMQVRVPSKRG